MPDLIERISDRISRPKCERVWVGDRHKNCDSIQFKSLFLFKYTQRRIVVYSLILARSPDICVDTDAF